MVEYMPKKQEVLGSIPSASETGRWMSVSPELRIQRRECYKLKVILDYKVSLRLAWAT